MRKFFVWSGLLLVAVLLSGCGRRAPSHQQKDQPVPVSAARVGQMAFPVYLDGLGTVQAFRTVNVQPQVSGKLVSVPLVEGAEVAKGALLAKIDPRPFQATLDQALAKRAQDAALLANAKRDLERYQGLVKQGYVSRQQRDQQLETVRQYTAAVKADEAAIDSARIQLGYTTIVSPIEGRLGIRQVDVGNVVQAASSSIVVVTQIKPISVLFTLPEQSVQQVREAMVGGKSLQVQLMSRTDGSRLATGTLTVMSNQIDQSTGTIQLKATFANQDELLWPGEFVNVRLLLRTLPNALVVPDTAVQRGPDGAYVYLVSAQDTAQMQPVTVGATEDHKTVVTSGLKLGQQLVIDGQFRLKPGSRLRVGAPVVAGSASPAPKTGKHAAKAAQ